MITAEQFNEASIEVKRKIIKDLLKERKYGFINQLVFHDMFIYFHCGTSKVISKAYAARFPESITGELKKNLGESFCSLIVWDDSQEVKTSMQDLQSKLRNAHNN